MTSSPQPTKSAQQTGTPPTSKSQTFNRATAFERLLPQDIDAERATLGAMLRGKEAIGEVIAVLKDVGREAFALEKHQDLYDVFIHLYVADQAIDGVLLKDELSRRGIWDKLGKYDYLGTLLTAAPSPLHAREYATVVLERYLLRRLIAATHRVMEAAFDSSQPAREVLDAAEREIFEVTEQRITGEAQMLPDLVHDAFRSIEARGEDALTGESSGFIELDQLTCGLQSGELIIIAGRPSMGKTAFGLNVAEHMAIVERKPVLFFSLEMSRMQLAQRILCSRARVNSHALRRGRQSAQDLSRLQAVAGDLSEAPMLIDDTSDLTILELRARARMAARRQQIRAIFIDYLQLMRVPKAENRQIEVSMISRGLKALAKDLHVPVVAMAQLNRGTEDKSRRGNRPRMSDLRESGAIEQDADVIALLHRESYYKTKEAGGADNGGELAPPTADPEEHVAELIIDKQRNGPTGIVRLHWNRNYTRFDNHKPNVDGADYGAAMASDATPF